MNSTIWYFVWNEEGVYSRYEDMWSMDIDLGIVRSLRLPNSEEVKLAVL